MNELNSKTSASLMVISFVTWQILIKFFPLNFKIIDYFLTLLFAFSTILFAIAVLKEDKPLSFAAFYWSSFGLPLFASQFLSIDYISQFVSIENSIWVLLAYFSALPFIVSALVIYQDLVCKRMIQIHRR